MIDLTWMAWTWPTALFFVAIAGLIALMGALEAVRPGGAPRFGILGFRTTRGDRLFVSLLGSAFLCLGLLWGGVFSLLAAGVVCAVWFAGVFRFV